jgi:pimeloyl-ACP methyl ester carboxylesterase
VATGVEFDVVVGSWHLHAERWGSPSAPLVLGVPGLSGNVKHFAFLGERIGGDTLQLVALDLRGRGRSAITPPGTYGWNTHARDVFDVASALGVEHFGVIGLSMGASVAMKAAELDPAPLDAIVLVDVAGRVDRGVGAAIAASVDRLGQRYESVERYLDAVRSQGLVVPWNEYWDRACRYELRHIDGGFQPRTDPGAVREERAYTATQDPYRRWAHLTMPVLLVRATQELRPAAGFVVPPGERDRFLHDVPHATVVEVDANHLTVTAPSRHRERHPDFPDRHAATLTTDSVPAALWGGWHGCDRERRLLGEIHAREPV